jgi:alkylated DNA repair dioxygenase AlkB
VYTPTTNGEVILEAFGADVRLQHRYFSTQEADRWEGVIRATVAFERPRYRFGNLWARSIAWYSDSDYRFGDNTFPAQPLPQGLEGLRKLVEADLGTEFNSVLVNLYPGKDAGVAWHADDDYDPLHSTIASLSFGAARPFELGRKGEKEPVVEAECLLDHGSLLVMAGETQERYVHRVPKVRSDVGPRINVTLRHMAGQRGRAPQRRAR